MRFDSDRAWRQLVEHGVVATMRFNRSRRVAGRRAPLYIKGMVVRIVRRGRVVGRGIVLGVVPNTVENRRRLVELSGFGSVEEWEKEALRLHRGRMPNAIVIVALLG